MFAEAIHSMAQAECGASYPDRDKQRHVMPDHLDLQGLYGGESRTEPNIHLA
jgi:hypothetical protein